LNTTIPYYEQYHSPLIASISADSIEEFEEMSQQIAAIESVAALELNISCPNLKDNGKAFGMDEDITYELTSRVRQVTDKPILTKLSPNVTDIQAIALAAERGGSDALVVANTPLAMAIDIYSRKPKIGNTMGGLSGPGIKPIIIRQSYQAQQVCRSPNIGCGGRKKAEDGREMRRAGGRAEH